jgi:hypothetical protein
VPRLLGLALLLLVAGCTSPAHPPTVAAAHDSGSSPGLPGVTVDGYHNSTGDIHDIGLVARNAGPHTYYVYTSQSGAWSDSMRGPHGEVTPRNNAYTQECSWRALAPGDVLRDEVTWDETLYVDQSEGKIHTEPAPRGHYAWTVRLTAWFEDTCPDIEDERAFVDLEFDVDV